MHNVSRSVWFLTHNKISFWNPSNGSHEDPTYTLKQHLFHNPNQVDSVWDTTRSQLVVYTMSYPPVEMNQNHLVLLLKGRDTWLPCIQSFWNSIKGLHHTLIGWPWYLHHISKSPSQEIVSTIQGQSLKTHCSMET